MRPVEVPVEHRLEFNQVLEHLYRQCSDAEQKLQMLIARVKQEEVIKRMVVIVSVCVQTPATVIDIHSLRCRSAPPKPSERCSRQ